VTRPLNHSDAGDEHRSALPAFIWYKDCENRILRANPLAAVTVLSPLSR
jgi:hypothetical protein